MFVVERGARADPVTSHKCNAVLVCLQPPADLKTLLAVEMPVNEIIQAGDTVQRDDTFFLDHVVFLVSSTFMSASPQVTDNDRLRHSGRGHSFQSAPHSI